MTRDALRREVEVAFAALLRDGRFSMFEVTEARAQLIGVQYTVEVSWEESSRTVDVTVARLNDHGAPTKVSLYEIVAANCPRKMSEFKDVRGFDPPHSRLEQLKRTAGLLVECGFALLSGDKSAFTETLKARGQIDLERTEAAKHVYETRCAAHRALKNGDYSKAMSLFSNIRDSLTEDDHKAIDAASRRTNS